LRFKRIVLFLVLSLLVCETSFLYEQYEALKNIGNKFEVKIDLSEDAKKIGLTEEKLRTVSELRLRKEGMTIVDETGLEIAIVYVNVIVVGTAYHLNLLICEWVVLIRPYAKWALVATYMQEGSGTHGGIPEWIVSSLNKLFDEFFNDYYKANPKENKKGSK